MAQEKPEGKHIYDYWEIDPIYYIDMSALVCRRNKEIGIELSELFSILDRDISYIENEEELNIENLEEISHRYQLYGANLALLIKYLYPIMEEAETIVRKYISKKEIIEKDFLD